MRQGLYMYAVVVVVVARLIMPALALFFYSLVVIFKTDASRSSFCLLNTLRQFWLRRTRAVRSAVLYGMYLAVASCFRL